MVVGRGGAFDASGSGGPCGLDVAGTARRGLGRGVGRCARGHLGSRRLADARARCFERPVFAGADHDLRQHGTRVVVLSSDVDPDRRNPTLARVRRFGGPEHARRTVLSRIQGVRRAKACSVLGPALAGSLLALLGLGASFGATALLFLVATALFGALARVAKPSGPPANEVVEEERARRSTRDELIEGLRYVLHDPVIRTLLLIVVGTNVAMMGPLYVGGPFSPSRASGVQGPLASWSPPQESVR